LAFFGYKQHKVTMQNCGNNHFTAHIIECSLLRIQQWNDNDRSYLLALVVALVLTHLQQSARQCEHLKGFFEVFISAFAVLSDSDELNKAISALYLSLVNVSRPAIRLPEQTIKQ
jgi:hypothetical protein